MGVDTTSSINVENVICDLEYCRIPFFSGKLDNYFCEGFTFREKLILQKPLQIQTLNTGSEQLLLLNNLYEDIIRFSLFVLSY